MQVNEIYNIIGDKKLKLLVDLFYEKIEKDELLNPMFPENKSFGKKFQYLFLKQIFGGSREYDKFRGHPKLRKRHFPFDIGWKERNRWIKLMSETMDELNMGEVRPVMNEYFEMMATKIMNKINENKVTFNLT